MHFHKWGKWETIPGSTTQKRECGGCGLAQITNERHTHVWSKYGQRPGFAVRGGKSFPMVVNVRKCQTCGIEEVE